MNPKKSKTNLSTTLYMTVVFIFLHFAVFLLLYLLIGKGPVALVISMIFASTTIILDSLLVYFSFLRDRKNPPVIYLR